MRIMPLQPPLLLALALLLPLAPAVAQETEVVLEEAFPSLPTLVRPVALEAAPDGSGRLFVVEQDGRIRSFANAAAEEAPVFLDLTERVNTEPSWEEGLLGLAFHPDYAENGHVFVHYTAFPREGEQAHRTIIARFTRSGDDPLTADPDSELVLLDIEQPAATHNGGQLAFGADGMLYLSLGDGGGGGLDVFENGQDRTTLLGSILRLDVDSPAGGRNYSIPAGNPFVGNAEGWREEIWAYGLRNPWRFSIDPATGWLWIGDVGAGTQEEVSVAQEGGVNFGWDVKEGNHCWGPDPETEPDCDSPVLTDPVWDYWQSGGNAITGGYVYRGSAVPSLVGKYVYGDFISGRVWALTYEEGEETENEELLQQALVAAFGVDADEELHVLSFDGRIYRLAERVVSDEDVAPPAPTALRLAGPNPFRSGTRLALDAPAGAEVELMVFDTLGREVAVLYEGTGAPATVALDGSALAPGLYVVRLLLDGEPAGTRRVVRLR